jgi:hypothetical protein
VHCQNHVLTYLGVEMRAASQHVQNPPFTIDIWMLSTYNRRRAAVQCMHGLSFTIDIWMLSPFNPQRAAVHICCPARAACSRCFSCVARVLPCSISQPKHNVSERNKCVTLRASTHALDRTKLLCTACLHRVRSAQAGFKCAACPPVLHAPRDDGALRASPARFTRSTLRVHSNCERMMRCSALHPRLTVTSKLAAHTLGVHGFRCLCERMMRCGALHPRLTVYH